MGVFFFFFLFCHIEIFSELLLRGMCMLKQTQKVKERKMGTREGRRRCAQRTWKHAPN